MRREELPTNFMVSPGDVTQVLDALDENFLLSCYLIFSRETAASMFPLLNCKSSHTSHSLVKKSVSYSVVTSNPSPFVLSLLAIIVKVMMTAGLSVS